MSKKQSIKFNQTKNTKLKLTRKYRHQTNNLTLFDAFL